MGVPNAPIKFHFGEVGEEVFSRTVPYVWGRGYGSYPGGNVRAPTVLPTTLTHL